MRKTTKTSRNVETVRADSLKLMVRAVFAGDDPDGRPDPVGAAEQLGQAGFQVHQLPVWIDRGYGTRTTTSSS
jgi:hypothetical protein